MVKELEVWKTGSKLKPVAEVHLCEDCSRDVNCPIKKLKSHIGQAVSNFNPATLAKNTGLVFYDSFIRLYGSDQGQHISFECYEKGSGAVEFHTEEI